MIDFNKMLQKIAKRLFIGFSISYRLEIGVENMINSLTKEVMVDVKLLTNPKNFYKVKRRIELTNPRDIQMTIEGCQRPVVNNSAIDVPNLKENVAIILQTLKNKCVINIDPAQQDMAVVQDHLGQVLANLRSKMKQSYDEVIGLVVGGRSYDVSNKFADKGVQLTDEVCEFMEAEHIPSTKLLEQCMDRHSKGIDIYSHRDDAVLSGGIMNKFAGVKLENIKNKGEELFEIFEVSPYAPIKVVDKIEPDKSTNLRFLF